MADAWVWWVATQGQEDLGPYASASFTFNGPPSAPTLVSPANGVSMSASGGNIVYDWEFNDDISDTQTEYALVRKKMP